jgi:RNA polymerase sigma-70 factor (ECF subfamily)
MSESPQIERQAWLRQAALSGDESAWRSLYDESFEALDRFVLWRCAGRRDAADEVVQQTWLIAVRRLKAFDPQRGMFVDWLRGIATNELSNYQRRVRRDGRQSSLDGNDEVPQGGEPLAESQEADELLAALPARQQAVLRAKYLDGESVAEIADQWQETPKAVESLLARARLALRRLYESLGGEPNE